MSCDVENQLISTFQTFNQKENISNQRHEIFLNLNQHRELFPQPISVWFILFFLVASLNNFIGSFI